MEPHNLKYRTFIHYLSGNCTEQERKAVKEWVQADPENRKKLEAFEHIWEQSAHDLEPEKEQFDVHKDWKSIEQKISDWEAGRSKKSVSETPGVPGTFRTAPVYQLVRVAAVFLVAALIGVFAYQNWGINQAEENDPVLREITTAMGQRVNLRLSDGTRVLLNAGSEIKLPEVFAPDKREVFLTGEAYFDVAENPEKPFLIHTSGSTTRVLGTSFSLSAYPEDDEVLLAVEEGRVSFGINGKDALNKEIGSRELARLNRESRKVMTDMIVDMELYLGWTKGYLKFRETPMRQVATDLERRYGVQVTFDDRAIESMVLTALLKSRSIQNVLDVIAMSLDIGYRLEDDTVTFYVINGIGRS